LISKPLESAAAEAMLPSKLFQAHSEDRSADILMAISTSSPASKLLM